MALESKNGPKPLPHMGQECSGWKGSQSEHNCVTDTKKSAKTGQNWPKIAQTMAIFHHKWLILWRKKIIFINIQLPMGSGQHLIPIGYLEVPLPAACSLVWRALWNRPAPFILYKGCITVRGVYKKILFLKVETQVRGSLDLQIRKRGCCDRRPHRRSPHLPSLTLPLKKAPLSFDVNQIQDIFLDFFFLFLLSFLFLSLSLISILVSLYTGSPRIFRLN